LVQLGGSAAAGTAPSRGAPVAGLEPAPLHQLVEVEGGQTAGDPGVGGDILPGDGAALGPAEEVHAPAHRVVQRRQQLDASFEAATHVMDSTDNEHWQNGPGRTTPATKRILLARWRCAGCSWPGRRPCWA